MRALFFIISLFLTILGWGQIRTTVTRVKSPVIYENGKSGFIKQGVEIVILSEHIGNNLCKFAHNKKVGKININDLVVDQELDNFFFATERMEKIKKEKIKAFNERAKKITPIVLPRLKNRELTYKGIIKQKTQLFDNIGCKTHPYNTIPPTFLLSGTPVSVFYYHKSDDGEIAGVTNDVLCGYIKAHDLSMDSICLDTLYYIPVKEKNECAMDFREYRLLEIQAYLKERAEKKKIEELQQKHAIQDETFKKGNLITIESLYFNMNSVGLLEPKIRFINNSSKDIKYITFNFYFKNGVDDIVYNTIDRSETHISCKVTGYINGYELGYGSWDSEFYNTTAKTIHISSINIIYKDGSTRTIGSQKCKELVQASK